MNFDINLICIVYKIWINIYIIKKDVKIFVIVIGLKCLLYFYNIVIVFYDVIFYNIVIVFLLLL